MSFFLFFNDTATTEIYTLSLHDALPISSCVTCDAARGVSSVEFRSGAGSASGPTLAPEPRTALLPPLPPAVWSRPPLRAPADRKSTRLNSSHLVISYAVFCLQKKNDRPP